MYYVVLGFIITCIVAVFISVIFHGSNDYVDPDLFTPYVANRLRKKGLLLQNRTVEMVNLKIILISIL